MEITKKRYTIAVLDENGDETGERATFTAGDLLTAMTAARERWPGVLLMWIGRDGT